MDALLYQQKSTFLKQEPLSFGPLDALFLNHILFSHGFHSVVFSRLLMLAKHNFAKGTSAQDLDDVEFFKVGVVFAGLAFEDDLRFWFQQYIVLHIGYGTLRYFSSTMIG